MLFPRLAAAICVLLLIGSLALACIAGVAHIGLVLSHGDSLEHANGKIVSIGPGKDFILEINHGQELHFKCGKQCRASLGHMQRHLREHAATDVYYIQGHNILLALDVD